MGRIRMLFKNYLWLPNGKLAIKKGSLLDLFIMIFIPKTIGYYEIVRIGRQTDWSVFYFNRDGGKHGLER